MSNDIYNHYIVKFNVYDSTFLITDDIASFKSGFRSLYAFSKEDAEAIAASSNFSGFKGTVWSPYLSVDIDSYEKGEEVRKRLTASGLAFFMYESGSKGYHFDILREAHPSHLLPQIDREWVKTHVPEADLSIYSSLHMYRLPGTVHHKTGKPKRYLEGHTGLYIDLREYKMVTERPKRQHHLIEAGTIYGDSLFLDPYIMSMTVPHDEGDRHRSLLNLGLALKRKGEPIEFIQRWLYHTQLLFSEPKPDGELERIVDFIEGAYLE